MMRKYIFYILACFHFIEMYAQDIEKLSWAKVSNKMPLEWYASEQAVQIADTVVKYQTEIGGWPKNVGFHKKVNQKEMERVRTSGIGATFDNGATINEMRFLAKVYESHPDKRYKEAFIKAFDYILKAQYDNGGWPQFYPVRKGRSVAYSGQITYNDNAFVNVMYMLQDIYKNSDCVKPLKLDEGIRQQARSAFDKGVQCILNTQIKCDGKLTVWCAQHDVNTLAPAKARAYELPSYSGAESAALVLLLMTIPNPSQEVIASIEGAVKWFEEHQISDMRYERYLDDKGERNARLIPDKGEVIWARFYDLDTGKPFFCDRDGVKRSSIDELGKERRGGYSWYVTSPKRVLDTYQKWIKTFKM